MSVKVTLLGRLGNNLFQYALGRIIAEYHGFELECEQSSQLGIFRKGRPFDSGPCATLKELASHFPHAQLHIPGRRISNPVDSFEIQSGNRWRGQTIDLASILANRAPRQIRLKGFFQRFEYFAPYRNQIREWFKLRALETPFVIKQSDILVNIRRGFDYSSFSWTLPLQYYQGVLSNLSDLGQMYICGTCVDEQVRHSFDKYEPIYYDATPIEHFNFIMRFNRIILSNSTFAWWAAFLSEASELYAARSTQPDLYTFTGFEEVDLHMREQRYHEIECSTLSV